jgi:hypothetical protein
MIHWARFKSVVGLASSFVVFHPWLTLAQSTPSVQLPDVVGDRYAQEIGRAVEQGIISGFEDHTFRPQAPLTREQLVSISVNAMSAVTLDCTFRTKPSLPPIPVQATTNPFPDVDRTRWSAAKIAYLKTIGILRGYPDGTFRPTQPVTRAELVLTLQAIDRYLVEYRRCDGRNIFPPPDPLPFSDIGNHWARDRIHEMSTNCHQGRVATPLNEQGTRFAPDAPALRNYAAAATWRTVVCLNVPIIPS